MFMTKSKFIIFFAFLTMISSSTTWWSWKMIRKLTECEVLRENLQPWNT